MSGLACPSCGGHLEHAPDCGRVGRTCGACGALPPDEHSEPQCAADCPLLVAAATLPYSSSSTASPLELRKGAPEVQLFTARALALLSMNPELGPLLGKRYEVAVIAVDLRGPVMVRGISMAFAKGRDQVGRATEMLAQTLGTLAQLNPERAGEILAEIGRAMSRALRAAAR